MRVVPDYPVGGDHDALVEVVDQDDKMLLAIAGADGLDAASEMDLDAVVGTVRAGHMRDGDCCPRSPWRIAVAAPDL